MCVCVFVAIKALNEVAQQIDDAFSAVAEGLSKATTGIQLLDDLFKAGIKVNKKNDCLCLCLCFCLVLRL